MMNSNKTDIAFLIAGFLSHSLNDAELQELEQWIDEDATHRQEFNKLRSAWIQSGYESGKKSFDSRSGWPAVEQKINRTKANKFRMFTSVRYAASLLFCFVLGAAISAIIMRKEPNQPIQLATSTTITVPLGAKSNITLPDGSTVWLNAGSEITYSSDFGWKTRDLQLSGEAFFDVKSDPLNPFNVHTSDMIVRALGTRFNVKAYPDDNNIAATLEEGIVDVMLQIPGKTTLHPISLKPNEQLVIRKSQNEESQIADEQSDQKGEMQQSDNEDLIVKEVIVRSNVKTELSTSWKDEKWIIDNQQLSVFVADLERRYNLDVIFTTNDLNNYKFSGTIENQTAEQIFIALSLTAPINYKFDKNKVVLSLNEMDKNKFTKILKNKK